MEIFILEAEAWFKFNQVYEQSRMINHMGAQLEGTAREWWTSKLRIDRAREGRLFNDWHYFTERLSEQFNPHNARMEAYNKLLALRLTSDTPGAATRHGIGHWARDCPSRRVNPLSSRPMGPKVMLIPATHGPDHEEEHNDDDDEGNVSKAVLELSGMVQDHPARILADTGAGFSASMQVSIGTHNLGVGADKGVEMEVEVDKVVTAADILKPYQHLRDVFDEVEADKLPHHTEHDLHLELIEGGKPPQGPLYLKGPKEMSELRRYLDENLEKGFIRPSKSPARSPVLFVPKKDGAPSCISTRRQGGEPDALTRRTDMQPAGEEQDHNVRRQLTPPRVFKETADHDSLLEEGLSRSGMTYGTVGGRLVIPKPLATPDRPWGSISLDFIEGLPPSKKYDSKTYDSILVIVDRLTKFAILAPTHKTVTAKQTAVLLYGHMVRLFGYPDHMVSDRGRQFISGAWKAFAEQMGVKHSLSTAYHPQTDGQTERVNQVIEQYLRMYCNYEQDDWANLLDTAAFVYNNMVHNSIGVSPFFACYGWNPKAHPDIPQRLGVNDPGRFEYLMDGKERCKYLQEQIREAQRRSVDQYNRKHKDIEFKVGDMVYINCRNWKTRRPTPKLDTWFAGPYPVQEQVGCRAYRITLPANLRVHDVFHVSMLEPARTSSLPQRAEQPTIPSLPDEDLDFEVEALINKHSHNRTTEYKVLWRGYSEEAASWEPVENLNCPDLIQEYEVSEGGRVSRQSRERRREQEE
ncbi:hypothetical protein NDA15_002728 [Ustilago hordei]|nr:hypothetical protein NDA15_002728 [Ustilago hordei]